MSRSQWLARGLGFAGAILLASWFSEIVWSQWRSECPRQNLGGIVPNTKEWGHFQTKWRRWPGEERLDEINPRAVQADVLPTPDAQEVMPLPKIVVPKGPPKPEEPKEPEPGGFLSPGGTITPPEGAPVPGAAPGGELPSESPPEGGAQPSNAEKLPDLPDAASEPDKSMGPLPFERTPPAPPPPSELKKMLEPPPATNPATPADSKQNSPPAEDPAKKEATPFSDESKPKEVSPPKEEPKQTVPPPFQDEPPLKEPAPPKEEPKQTWAPPPREEPQQTWPPIPREEPKQAWAPPPKEEPKLEAPAPPITIPNPKALSKKTARPKAAQPLPVREVRHEDVVALTDNYEPERNAALPAYRADPIEAETPSSSAQKIKAASFESESNTPIQPTESVEVSDKYEVPSEALNGYCPVELGSNGRWIKGDLRWTVVHKGWIFRLSGVEQRQQFLENPDRFAPVNSGNDLVLTVDAHRQVPGLPAYCATYNGRLYMFSSEESQAKFNKNPQLYTSEK